MSSLRFKFNHALSWNRLALFLSFIIHCPILLLGWSSRDVPLLFIPPGIVAQQTFPSSLRWRHPRAQRHFSGLLWTFFFSLIAPGVGKLSLWLYFISPTLWGWQLFFFNHWVNFCVLAELLTAGDFFEKSIKVRWGGRKCRADSALIFALLCSIVVQYILRAIRWTAQQFLLLFSFRPQESSCCTRQDGPMRFQYKEKALKK